MIKLSYRPIRFEVKGKQDFEYPFDRDKSLSAYLEQAGIDCKDCDIIILGKTEKSLDKKLDDGVEVIVTPKVEIPAAIFVWFGMSAAAAAFWSAVTSVLFAVLSVAYSIYSAMTARTKLPSFGLSNTGSDGIDENSPTYGWDGIRTIQEVGVPVKLIYGRRKVGGAKVCRL